MNCETLLERRFSRSADRLETVDKIDLLVVARKVERLPGDLGRRDVNLGVDREEAGLGLRLGVLARLGERRREERTYVLVVLHASEALVGDRRTHPVRPQLLVLVPRRNERRRSHLLSIQAKRDCNGPRISSSRSRSERARLTFLRSVLADGESARDGFRSCDGMLAELGRWRGGGADRRSCRTQVGTGRGRRREPWRERGRR